MLRLLKGLFHREDIDPDAIREERWTADFSKPRSSRFKAENAEDYEAKLSRRGVDLHLKKSRMFAWVEDPLYRYGNVEIEATVRFPSDEGDSSGYAAAGVLFRYSDAGSYYSFLVSTKGFFRVEAIFNGSPMPLIGWTETPEPIEVGSAVRLRAIALGDRMSFMINDRWAAEVTDGTLSVGRAAFAVASYENSGKVHARLESFRIESRPMEVETLHYRWNSYVRIDPAARQRLAETFMSMGQPLSALVQIKRIWKTDQRVSIATQRSAKTLLLAAECAMLLSLYAEAEEYLDRCVEADSASEEARRAVAEKAKLLYLANRFAELRDHAEEAVGLYPEDSTLRTLLGHAYWNLGAWDHAATEYERAYALEPKNGIIALNAARAKEKIGDKGGAFRHYLEAAVAFLQAEAYDDLTITLPRLRELGPRDPAVRAIAGKRAYAMEDWTLAEKELSAAMNKAGKASEDSAVPYLLALLRIRAGKRAEALPLLERAVQLESHFAPYRFRLAETRFLLSGDSSDPKLTMDLEEALRLFPDDGWTVNLAGQVEIARGDLNAAARHIEKAATLLPDEDAVIVNRAELAFLRGDAQGALALLNRGKEPTGVLANEAGNILVRLEQWEEAREAYARALSAAPSDIDFLRNQASCMVQLGLYGEADDILSKLVDLDPGARTLDLIAYVAIKKGEYARAEAAYRVGLEHYPEDKALLAGLAWTYLSMARWKSAEETIERLEALDSGTNSAVVAELRQRYVEATTKQVSCASCDRSWRILKDAPTVAAFRLVAEPPDELPAGTCPKCGKTFCIGCGKKHLVDGRFVCPECAERLKLLDEGLKKLLFDWSNNGKG
ncbi:MAG: tetratricopeptide repeat protein [Treponemataceae bacterium]